MQLRQQARPPALRKLTGLGKSWRNSFKTTNPKKSSAVAAGAPEKLTGSTPEYASISAHNNSNLSILQADMNPNHPFGRDDFFSPTEDYPEETNPAIPIPPKIPKKRKKTGLRLAGLGRRSFDWDWTDSKCDEDELATAKSDVHMTSPLHEAARLGNPSLVSIMLQHGGNPNARDGKLRTVLHMAAGGLTEMEAMYRNSLNRECGDGARLDVGIRVPVINEDLEIVDSEDDQPVKRVARAMSKMWKNMQKDGAKYTGNDHVINKTPSAEDWRKQAAARMDTLLTILAWLHPEDDSPDSGEGPSINSVDSRGRTALHYAGELGRSDVCTALVSSFGTILTVVDEFGRTPCELAGVQGHAELAAQLEARALLYMDPYGMDDELMISVLTGSRAQAHGRKSLAPPFCWFDTWTRMEVQAERKKRVALVLERMKEILRRKQKDLEITEYMLNQCIDESIDSCLNMSMSERGNDRYEFDQFNATQDATQEDIAKMSWREHDHYEELEAETGVELDANNKVLDVEEDSIQANKKVESFGDAVGGSDAPKDSYFDQETGISSLVFGAAAKVEDEELDMDRKPAASIFNEQIVSHDEDSWLTGDVYLDIQERAAAKVAEDVTDATSSATLRESFVIDTTSVSEHDEAIACLNEPYVERFLASFSWNVETALVAFEQSPSQALENAGITFSTLNTERLHSKEMTAVCLICCDEYDIDSPNWIILKGCKHYFCSDCLGDYISESARTRETGISIDCPHHECKVPLDVGELELLSPSPEIFTSLTVAADDNFIATASDLCFCPHPGCEGVVRKYIPQFLISNKLDSDLMDYAGATCIAVSKTENDASELTYEGVHDENYKLTTNTVQPIKAHRFCSACGDTKIHWPVPCNILEKWKEKIEEEIGELDEEEGGAKNSNGFDDVAQRLWMKANTRPCPKCKCPIEKMDGCNHMTCSNRQCRHEFCWICREDWKLHNTETGGFFRCNRWQVDYKHQFYDTPPPPPLPEQRMPLTPNPINPLPTGPSLSDQDHYGTALHSARVAWKKAKEMGRFLHHYRRWTAHSESAVLERNMAETVCTRLAPVVEAAILFNGRDDFDFNGRGLSFVHSAFTELLESRSLLQHSYAFAFFRYPITYQARRSRANKAREREKQTFEQLQAELEMLTEQMSDIVARKHLRATQVQIMFLTDGACQKRSELSSLMLSLLHQQRVDTKNEAAREKEEEEKKRNQQSPLDISQLSLPSTSEFPDQYGAAAGQAPSRLLRLMESHQRQTHAVYGESDSDDEYLLNSSRARMERVEEDAMRQAIRASMAAYHSEPDIDIAGASDWSCGVCTYMNASGRHCAMCGVSRQL